MKNLKRILTLCLLAVMLATLLLPAVSTSAKVNPGAKYPIKNRDLVKDVVFDVAGTTAPCIELPYLSLSVLDSDIEGHKPIIDNCSKQAARPNLWNSYPHPGEVKRSADLLFTDMWVLRLCYGDKNGENVVLCPWGYRGSKGNSFNWEDRTVRLLLDFDEDEYDLRNFGLRFTPIMPRYTDWDIHPRGVHKKEWWTRNASDTDWGDHIHDYVVDGVTKTCTEPFIYEGPKDQGMYRNLDHGWWQYVTEGELTTDDWVETGHAYLNFEEQSMRFDMRFPGIYMLFYFDSEENRQLYGADPPYALWVPGNPNDNPDDHPTYPGKYPQEGTVEYLKDLEYVGGTVSSATPTSTGTTTTETPTPPPAGELGDANCDDKINIDDILFVRDEIFGANKITVLGRLNLKMSATDTCKIDHILAIRDVIFGGEYVIK